MMPSSNAMPNLHFGRPAAIQLFEVLKSALEGTDLSESDRAFFPAGAWTNDQVPEIKSDAEYRRYVKLHRKLLAKLEAKLPPRSDPRWDREFAAKVRTPESLLETAINARIIEWEDLLEEVQPGAP
jgi:hypothetical protein